MPLLMKLKKKENKKKHKTFKTQNTSQKWGLVHETKPFHQVVYWLADFTVLRKNSRFLPLDTFNGGNQRKVTLVGASPQLKTDDPWGVTSRTI